MNNDFLILFLKIIEILILFLAIVFTLGVVWRVEKKLDISYKLFFSAIFFLAVAEIADLFYFRGNLNKELFLISFKSASALFFLLGIIEMRRAIRSIDGELINNKSNEKTDSAEN